MASPRSSSRGKTGKQPSGGQIPLPDPPLRIAAFNIQVFGLEKFKNKALTDVLLKILSRYDLTVVQEVRDRTQTAVAQLVKSLNKLNPDDPFAVLESERLGRTSSKEQYVFIYRSSRVKVVDSYQFDDGVDDGSDVFQREPFAARFSAPSTELEDFAIIAIHTDPDDAAKEIGDLHKVYDGTKRRWKLEDILIAGDFNADGGYVSKKDWSKIALRTDARFHWLIDDNVDTTVGKSDRAYDRFVVAGENFLKNIVPGSARVFRFDEEFKLSEEKAKEVSDHYPIEMEIIGKGHAGKSAMPGQAKIGAELSVVLRQHKALSSLGDVRKLFRSPAHAESTGSGGFESLVLKANDSSVHEARCVRRGVRDVLAALGDFREAFPGLLADRTLAMAATYLTSPAMTSAAALPPAHGRARALEEEERGGSSEYDVTVVVSLREPCLCDVIISRRVG